MTPPPTSPLGYGTDWFYLLTPIALWALVALAAVRRGKGSSLLARYGDGLGQFTGLPAWAAAGYVTTVASLLVAALGFYWDVAWHVDLGRDEVLFTPAHTAILFGLGGIVLSACVTIAVATVTSADVALRWKHWRAPRTAVAIGVCGFGAILGFPLDDFWHRAYGIDVTMWGPTHIVMIGGASLTPLLLLGMIHEAGRTLRPRVTKRMTAVLCGATMTGLSTFQLEFDLGVSQWQHLYHPVLISIAASIGLTIARIVIGPGGALFAAGEFVIQRTLIALLLGQALNLTTPHFALYIGCALAVEFGVAVTRRWQPVPRALVIGTSVGTFGLATEWAWTQAFGRHPWTVGLFPEILIASAAALPAALLGLAAARSLTGRGGLPRAAVALGLVGVVVALAIPSPRRGADATVTLRSTPAGEGRAFVEVQIDPPSVVDRPDRFEVFSWQGGDSELARLRPVREGVWRTETAVPVNGLWKTLFRMAQGPVLAGAPVYMPRDDEIGAPEVPAVPERTLPLARDTQYLMREAKAGAAWPAVVAYIAVGTIAIGWLTAVLTAYSALARRTRRRPLDGARVVVTGALGGIGAAVIPALEHEGARVVGIDLVEGPNVIAADVRDAESARAAVAEAAGRLGGIDVLVNLAGIGRAQDAGDMPDVEARRVVDVNFWGTWHTTAAAVPWLAESRGHVVITASGLAVATVPWAAAYAASKRAVSAYADTLRVEYRDRLTVTVVNPGYVRTAIHEVPAASGASLEGTVPADPMPLVVRAYERAVIERPRVIATSPRTTILLTLAKAFPAMADSTTVRRLSGLGRKDPGFVLTDAELARRRTARETARR